MQPHVGTTFPQANSQTYTYMEFVAGALMVHFQIEFQYRSIELAITMSTRGEGDGGEQQEASTRTWLQSVACTLCTCMPRVADNSQECPSPNTPELYT